MPVSYSVNPDAGGDAVANFIIPAPFVQINKDYDRTGDGAVLGESQFVGHGAGLSSVKNADGVVLKAGLDFRLAQPEYRGENPARVGAEGGRVAVPVLNGA